MREYRPNNLEPLVTMFFLFLLLIEQIIWKIYNPNSGIIVMAGIFVFNIYAIAKARKEWNCTYLIDDEKITYIYNGGREKIEMHWTSVIEAKAFGWKYFPLMFKNFILDDGHSIIPIRMVGFKQYKYVWLFVYDKIREKSSSVMTNNNLDKTIQIIRKQLETQEDG